MARGLKPDHMCWAKCLDVNRVNPLLPLPNPGHEALEATLLARADLPGGRIVPADGSVVLYGSSDA